MIVGKWFYAILKTHASITHEIEKWLTQSYQDPCIFIEKNSDPRELSNIFPKKGAY